MKIQTKVLTVWLVIFLLPACNQKPGNNDAQSKTTDTSKALQTTPNETTVNPYAAVDISPMDMSYFPPAYPQLKMGNSINGDPLARVIYSRPHLQGRKLFHDVLKYGEPWRLGANESTELQLYSDAVIQDKKIKAGRYVLYCIPEPDQWTIVLNSNIDSWGLKPDSTKDIARFIVPVKQSANHLEYFTIVFEKTVSGADMIMAWDNLEARLPVNF